MKKIYEVEANCLFDKSLVLPLIRSSKEVKVASAAEIMRQAGVPNMLGGRILNLRIE